MTFLDALLKYIMCEGARFTVQVTVGYFCSQKWLHVVSNHILLLGEDQTFITLPSPNEQIIKCNLFTLLKYMNKLTGLILEMFSSNDLS